MRGTPIVIDENVAVPMRDGVVLRCDVYRPRGSDRFPALLLRTPYGRREAQTIAYAHPMWYARHGYLVVVQDMRGRGDSGGEFEPFDAEAEDGCDTIAWAAAHRHSNGKVGMYGYSYAAFAQLAVAALNPPDLCCIAPAMAPHDLYETWMYPGGALSLAFAVGWAVNLAREHARRRAAGGVVMSLDAALAHLAPTLWHSPLSTLPLLRSAGGAPYFFDWLEHPSRDSYWESKAAGCAAESHRVPALHVGGWWDVFLRGTLRNYRDGSMRAMGRRDTPSRLLIGPWYHLRWGRWTGELNLGADADNPIDRTQLEWFNTWLRSATPQGSAVRWYALNGGWRSGEAWPPDGAQETVFYLTSQGRANSVGGDGLLVAEPSEHAPADVYVSDPSSPVPSIGGWSCCYPDVAPMGPRDQRPVESRNDVLVYSSRPFMSLVELAGPVRAEVWAAADTPDVDVIARLTIVSPDGSSVNIAEGLRRARYRGGFRTPLPLIPHQPERFDIDMGAIAAVVPAGSSLRLHVSSSSFPSYDRNTNTGGLVATEDALAFRPATVMVFHDGDCPSRLTVTAVRMP